MMIPFSLRAGEGIGPEGVHPEDLGPNVMSPRRAGFNINSTPAPTQSSRLSSGADT
jgi:hypothetical protein